MVRLLNRGRLPGAGLLTAVAALIALPAAAADPGQGKAVFASQCSVCHSAAKGGAAILGPTLFGVVGRPAASIKGFAYTPGMKAAGFTWTDDRLRAYLPAPAKLVPGTRMTYPGLKDPVKLENLIAYLGTLQ